MKRLFAVLAALALLAGCAHERDLEPVWQAELANGGRVSLGNCTVSEEAAAFYPEPGSEPVTLPLLRAEGVPVFTFTGVAAGDIAIYFAAADGTAYTHYDARLPQIKVDYRLNENADGSVRVRLDTVYGFRIAVGEQQWLVACTREKL